MRLRQTSRTRFTFVVRLRLSRLSDLRPIVSPQSDHCGCAAGARQKFSEAGGSMRSPDLLWAASRCPAHAKPVAIAHKAAHPCRCRSAACPALGDAGGDQRELGFARLGEANLESWAPSEISRVNREKGRGGGRTPPPVMRTSGR
jgi:hypothetical protein